MSKLTKIDEARAKSNVEPLNRPMKRSPPEIKIGSELHQAQRVWEGLGISAQELCESFGTTSPQFAACELVRLMSNFPEDIREQYANAALAMIHNLKPKNEVEFLLATQMYATHVAATGLLKKVSQSEFAANTAIKLLRTFTAQTEAFAKMRRGGEQTVRVEHVHVHSGGQAVVGNVTQAPPGDGRYNEIARQPHATDDARAIALATGSPVWSENEIGTALPIANRKREK